MHAWAAGETLTEVLEDDEDLTGGDFVRHVKQVIDLLHQIGDVAPNPETADRARGAARDCFRGVVAASSLLRPDASAPVMPAPTPDDQARGTA